MHLAVRDQFEGWARLVSGGRRDDQLVIRISNPGLSSLASTICFMTWLFKAIRAGCPGSHGIFIGLGRNSGNAAGWLGVGCGPCGARVKVAPKVGVGDAFTGAGIPTVPALLAKVDIAEPLPGAGRTARQPGSRVVIQHRSVEQPTPGSFGAEQKRRYFPKNCLLPCCVFIRC